MRTDDDDPLFRFLVHDADGRVAVEVSGEIDVASKEKLNAVFETLDLMVAANDIRAITIDMSQVAFCDSTGVAFLLRVQERAVHCGASFELQQVSDSVRRVLDALSLNDLVSDGQVS
jgi:anti-anti-sigma factor